MSLNFLVPLAFLGALAVAVPLLLHLIDRRRVPQIDFPALRFLLSAQKKLKRRRRVRDPFLLLLRILALLAVVLAFTSPLLQYQTQVPAGADLGNNVIFLLDNSMSMSYQIDGKSLLERARERVEEVVQRLPEGGRVGLIVFNQEPNDLLGGVTPDVGRLRRVLAEVKPSYGETSLKPAVLAGLRALLSSPEGGGDLYLLSDNTAVSLPGEVGLKLPPQLEGRVRLVVTQLSDEKRSNRSLLSVQAGREGGEGGKVKITAQVRAQGEGLSAESPLDLSLGGQVLSRGFVSGGEGQREKVFTLPAQVDPEGEGTLTLGPDNLEADNSTYFRLTSRRDLNVLVIDGEPGEYLTSAESFFVERALNPRRASGSRVTPVVVGEGAVPKLDPRQYPVVYLLNVSDPGPLAERLLNYVKAGGGLLIGVGSQVNPEVYNRRLGELLPASMGEVKAASMDLTGEKPPALMMPEVNHPIFQVFREAGSNVFGTIAFYKVVPTAPTLKADASVLLKFTNGLPALLAREVGAGRVLLFTSSMDRDWTDFPLKSIFLPFVQEATHYLARNPTGEEKNARFLVEQPVVLELVPSQKKLWVLTPDGKEELLDQGGALRPGEEGRPRRVIFRGARVPGHYTVMEREGSNVVVRPELGFAVNIPERETDLSPMPAGALQEKLLGLPVLMEGQGEVKGEVTVDRRRPLNHPLLWAGLLLLVLEGLWMAWKSRQGEQEQPSREPLSPSRAPAEETAA